MKKNKIIEIKDGKFKHFDGFTGIAKQGNYYVYFDYMKGCREGLGDLIGEGENIEEALIDALKNINKRMKKLANEFGKIIQTKKFDPYEMWYGKKNNKVRYCKEHKMIELDRDEE